VATAERAALVAELVALRRAHAETRALYERLFETAPVALLLVASDGRYLDANPAAAALLGYDRAELLGMRIGDTPAIGGVWTDEERASFVREGRWQGRMALRRRGGALVPVEALVAAVPLEAETVYIAALIDCSPRRAFDRMRRDLRLALAHARLGARARPG
jgi:PAS domain S-box-containing protein